MYLVFIPFSGTELQNPLELSVTRAIEVCFSGLVNGGGSVVSQKPE